MKSNNKIYSISGVIIDPIKLLAQVRVLDFELKIT